MIRFFSCRIFLGISININIIIRGVKKGRYLTYMQACIAVTKDCRVLEQDTILSPDENCFSDGLYGSVQRTVPFECPETNRLSIHYDTLSTNKAAVVIHHHKIIRN